MAPQSRKIMDFETPEVYGIYSVTSKNRDYVHFGIVKFVAFSDTDVIYDYRLLDAIILQDAPQIIANASLFNSSEIFKDRKMIGVSNKLESAEEVMRTVVAHHKAAGEMVVLNVTDETIRITKTDVIGPLPKLKI